MDISPEKITAELKTAALGRNLVVLSETDSTNSYAKRLAAQNALHGTAVIAQAQSAGRGRLGRSFVSPCGTGIYMSVIVRPEISIEKAQLITLCAAAAAAQATEELCCAQVGIKWVNDLYLNGRKICGILTEASLGSGGRLEYAVIGIGMNVLSTKEVFSAELRKIATSVEDETGAVIDRNRLCAVILRRLEETLSEIEGGAFLEEYRRREILTGNVITANLGDEVITGRAVGIDQSGSLTVELADGSVRKISSGEANLCRIKKD